MRRNYLMDGGGTAAPGGRPKPARRHRRPRLRTGRGQQQRQQRQRKQRRRGRGGRNPITAPLTLPELRRETRAATNLKFHPLERKIGADIRGSRRRQGEEDSWWQEYQDKVAQNRAENAAAYQQAAQQQQAMMQQASELDTQNTEKLDAEAKQSAELRGAEPSTAAAEREAAAQAQRNLAAINEAAGLANAGAANYAYLSDKQRIGKGQQIKARTDEQRRRRGYREDQRDLARERGDYATTYRGELRDKERRYGIERGVAQLDRRKQGADERQGRREGREAATERAEARRQQGIENSNKQRELELAEQEAREGGGGGQETREGRENAMSTARSIISLHGYPRTRADWSHLERVVAKEKEVSPAEARWAIQRLRRRRQRQQGNRGRGGATKVPYAP